jgi:hypothetical protein
MFELEIIGAPHSNYVCVALMRRGAVALDGYCQCHMARPSAREAASRPIPGQQR